jgi:hypothetical protein
MIFLKITFIDTLAILYYIHIQINGFFLFYDARGQVIIGCNNYTFYSLHILYVIMFSSLEEIRSLKKLVKRHCMDLRTV